MSEQAKIPESRSRSPELWDRVYKEYGQMLRGYIASRLHSPEDVDDLVQNVFATMVRRKHVPEDPRPYIYMVARNQLRSHWRQRKRRDDQTASLMLAGDDRIAGVPSPVDPLEELYSEEQRRMIVEAMERLPVGLARVLRLRVIQGLSLTETAQRVGCSSDAVKKRLQRAKRSLLAYCGDMEERRTRDVN